MVSNYDLHKSFMMATPAVDHAHVNAKDTYICDWLLLLDPWPSIYQSHLNFQ